MKGILKKVKGAFFEEDETQPVSAPPVQHTQQAVKQLIVATPSVTAAPSDNAVQAYLDKFEQIMKDENDRNHPGNDFYEFITMKKNMGMISDEATRYLATMGGWSAGDPKLNKALLLSTAKHYQDLFDKEAAEFEAAYQNSYNSKVGGLEQTITSKQEQVQRLIENMNVLNAELAAHKQQLADDTQKLTAKRDAFTKAAALKKAEIDSEVNKINQYIN